MYPQIQNHRYENSTFYLKECIHKYKTTGMKICGCIPLNKKCSFHTCGFVFVDAFL
jgi:hypothetical protein